MPLDMRRLTVVMKKHRVVGFVVLNIYQPDCFNWEKMRGEYRVLTVRPWNEDIEWLRAMTGKYGHCSQ